MREYIFIRRDMEENERRKKKQGENLPQSRMQIFLFTITHSCLLVVNHSGDTIFNRSALLYVNLYIWLISGEHEMINSLAKGNRLKDAAQLYLLTVLFILTDKLCVYNVGIGKQRKIFIRSPTGPALNSVRF